MSDPRYVVVRPWAAKIDGRIVLVTRKYDARLVELFGQEEVDRRVRDGYVGVRRENAG